MQAAETPTSSRRKAFGTIKLLAAIIAIAGVCAFNIHNGRENARHREALKTLEEAKQTIKAAEQKLREIQQPK